MLLEKSLGYKGLHKCTFKYRQYENTCTEFMYNETHAKPDQEAHRYTFLHSHTEQIHSRQAVMDRDCDRNMSSYVSTVQPVSDEDYLLQ